MDIDDMELTEGILYFIENIAEWSDATKIGSVLTGNVETNPAALANPKWSAPVYPNYRSAGCAFITSRWLLTWNFTNM
jgi:hypothetical protein